jgi:hypothetical protein
MDKDLILGELEELKSLTSREFDSDDYISDRVRVKELIDESRLEETELEAGITEELNDNTRYQNLSAELSANENSLRTNQADLENLLSDFNGARDFIAERRRNIRKLSSENTNLSFDKRRAEAASITNKDKNAVYNVIDAHYDRISNINEVMEQRRRRIIQYNKEIAEKEAAMKELAEKRKDLEKTIREQKAKVKKQQNNKRKMEKRYDFSNSEEGINQRRERLAEKIKRLEILRACLSTDPYKDLATAVDDYRRGLIDETELNNSLITIRHAIPILSKNKNIDENAQNAFFAKIDGMIEKLPKPEGYDKETVQSNMEKADKLYLNLHEGKAEKAQKSRRKKKEKTPIAIVSFKNNSKKEKWEEHKKKVKEKQIEKKKERLAKQAQNIETKSKSMQEKADKIKDKMEKVGTEEDKHKLKTWLQKIFGLPKKEKEQVISMAQELSDPEEDKPVAITKFGNMIKDTYAKFVNKFVYQQGWKKALRVFFLAASVVSAAALVLSNLPEIKQFFDNLADNVKGIIDPHHPKDGITPGQGLPNYSNEELKEHIKLMNERYPNNAFPDDKNSLIDYPILPKPEGHGGHGGGNGGAIDTGVNPNNPGGGGNSGENPGGNPGGGGTDPQHPVYTDYTLTTDQTPVKTEVAGEGVLINTGASNTEAAGKVGTTIVDGTGTAHNILNVGNDDSFKVHIPGIADPHSNGNGTSTIPLNNAEATAKINEANQQVSDTFGTLPSIGTEQNINSIAAAEAAKAQEAINLDALKQLDLLNGTNYSGSNPDLIQVDPIEYGIVR